MAAPEPLTWYSLFTTWDMPVAGVVLTALATGLYLWGVCRVHAWPVRYTTSLLAGIAVTVFAIGSGVNAYSDVLFVMHMAQHLLLIMVVPTLVILGKPLELLRRATTERTRTRLGRFSGTGLVRTVTHPVFGFAYYTIVVVGTHLTPFQQYALTQPWVHGLEILLYLSSGYLLLLPILGVEPIRNTMPYLMRIITLMAAMVVDTIVGVMLMMTPYVRFPAYAAVQRDWGPPVVEDLHWGGATMWIGGDGLMVLLAVLVISQWMNRSGGRIDLGPWLDSARRSALATTDPAGTGSVGPSDDIDDDEEALRAYNAMLARLAEAERGGSTGENSTRENSTERE